MSEVGFKLTDKTVVLAGPFGLLVQNLTTLLANCGADVAVVTDDVKSAQRVCQNIMDMREVSEKFGRATAIGADFGDEKSAAQSLSRSAEAFGSTDIYIDCHLFGLRLPFYADSAAAGPAMARETIEANFNSAFDTLQAMTAAAATFVKARSRGRILYLFHELDILAAKRVESPVFAQFGDFVRKTAQELSPQQAAVNAVAVGVNEEYLLSRFQKSASIQRALQELVKTLPAARLVDYADISNIVAFLASPLSNGISGQVLHVNHALLI
jgi:NAD(P)-dependent dehydrogenase (short-subunit alcohol dehydrogenase family)